MKEITIRSDDTSNSAITQLKNITLTLKVKFDLEQATKAQRESKGTALLFFNFGASWRWVVNATPEPL